MHLSMFCPDEALYTKFDKFFIGRFLWNHFYSLVLNISLEHSDEKNLLFNE